MICDSGGAQLRRTISRIVWLGVLLCLTAAGCGDDESHREAAEPIAPPPAAKSQGPASTDTGPAKHTIPRGLIEQPRKPQGVKGRFRELKNIRGGERRNDYTPEQIAELERLSAIGYVSGSIPSVGFQNVTVFDEERAESGLNFYLSGHGAEAALVDMHGNVLHRWSVGFADVWPGLEKKGRENLRLVVGDPSADLYGARVLEALWQRAPNLEARGVGGPALRSAGLECLADARELEVMGFTEVLRRLPSLLLQPLHLSQPHL